LKTTFVYLNKRIDDGLSVKSKRILKIMLR